MSLTRVVVECVFSAALAVATLSVVVSREWIERATGLSPDGGSGAAEWGLVAVLGIATVVVGTRGLLDLRRWRAATA